jgi:sorting nexin-27
MVLVLVTNKFDYSRNSVNVEGATHKQVVELIKDGGDRLVLMVISVHAIDAERFDPGAMEESTSMYRYDYSEKRSLPITIPSYQWLTIGTDRFVVRHYF